MPVLLTCAMDRAAMQERLMIAEARVREGKRRVALQQKLVRELDAQGDDSRAAMRLLAQYEESQGSLVADRDRLRKELSGQAN